MRRDHGVLTLSTNKGTGSRWLAQIPTPRGWCCVIMLMLSIPSAQATGLGGGLEPHPHLHTLY